MNDQPERNNENNENNASHYFNNAPSGYTAPFVDEKPPIRGTFGTLALIFGIFGVVCCCCCPVFPMIASILAIVFAVIDRKRFSSFRGITVAGLILGIIGTVLGIYMCVQLSSVGAVMGDPEFWRLYQEAMESGDTAALEQYLEQILGGGL